MVEQRAALQHCDTHRSRLLPLLLVLGGGLVLWWTLMTGTAHAAENPVDPLTHTVSDLAQQNVQPVVGHVEHITRAATRTATVVVRHAPAPKPQLPVVDPAPVIPTVHGDATVTHLAHPVRHHRAAQARTQPRTPAGAADHTAHTSLRAHQHRSAAPHHVDCPAAPAPTGSGDSAGAGSGPTAGALVEHPRTPELLASSEHSADPAPDLPADPAYPPGCSPD
jgi:hypothetical protein